MLRVVVMVYSLKREILYPSACGQMLCRGSRYILVSIFGSGNRLACVHRTVYLSDIPSGWRYGGSTLILRALHVPQPWDGFPVFTMMAKMCVTILEYVNPQQSFSRPVYHQFLNISKMNYERLNNNQRRRRERKMARAVM